MPELMQTNYMSGEKLVLEHRAYILHAGQRYYFQFVYFKIQLEGYKSVRTYLSLNISASTVFMD